MATTADHHYETLKSCHARSFELIKKALELDERSAVATKKKQAMSLYKKGLAELEIGVSLDWRLCPTHKHTSAKSLIEKMNGNLRSTRGRLADLEKQFGVTVGPVKRPSSQATNRPSTIAKVPMPSRAQSARSSSPSTSRKPLTAQQPNAALTTADRNKLLKGVDEKFGSAILEHMMESTGRVTFDDVAGLDTAKQALEEAVILPTLNPSVFTGLREPVQGILLFGPPGNGKTLLAKAVSTESKSVFFNISASALTSKWVGDAEKMVKALFQVARNAQPAIIFIDEIDSILCERSEKDNEVSRRMKTEFLLQFDGVSSNREDRILVMGATNRPYELDDAVIRRFPKRIMIDLPNAQARLVLLKALLAQQQNSLSAHDLRSLADRTAGYSNADLVTLAKDAAMAPIRELRKDRLADLRASQIRPLRLSDFETALGAVKPSTNDKHMDKLKEFAERCGQVA